MKPTINHKAELARAGIKINNAKKEDAPVEIRDSELAGRHEGRCAWEDGTKIGETWLPDEGA